MKKWYEALFADYAETYEEDFTKGTKREVDFIETEIKHNKRTKILDVGCGTGRHSVELARRGYDVTGIDLSLSQLKAAKKKAAGAGVDVRFLKRDARKFVFEDEFGLVIMLCEGAFSLMETDEGNFKILENCFRSLSKKGKIIFTCLNALFPLVDSLQEFVDKNSVEGKNSGYNFDYMTLRSRSILKTADDKGRKMTLHCDERYFLPSEITWMLRSLGFRKIGIYGCGIGK